MLRIISLLACLLLLNIILGTPSALAGSKVLSLDGDGDYVDVADSEDLHLQYPITIEGWVGTNNPSKSYQHIVGKRNDRLLGSYKVPYALRLDSGKPTFYFGTGNTWKIHRAEFQLSEAWYHVAATYDGNIVNIYVNGVKEYTQSETDTPFTNDISMTSGASIDPDEVFDGLLDEVRIWNIARTQEQIQENMNQPLENPESDPNLVGYWNFDNGTAEDLSQYANHGEFYGDAHTVDVIYVSFTGNDETGDGTKLNPYKTIQKGINKSGENDIVQALPGVYEENILLVSDLTVFGSGTEDTIITSASGNIMTANNVNNVALLGFTIDGQGSADNGILCSGTTSEMEIIDNVITKAKVGIKCLDSVKLSIEGNTIYQSIAHGIYCAGTSVVKIYKNSIEANGNHGIVCEGQTNTSITENIICHNWRGIACCGQDTNIIVEANSIQSNDLST